MSDIKTPVVKKTYKERYYEEKEKKRLKKLERKGATQVSKRVREIMEPKLMSENKDNVCQHERNQKQNGMSPKHPK